MLSCKKKPRLSRGILALRISWWTTRPPHTRLWSKSMWLPRANSSKSSKARSRLQHTLFSNRRLRSLRRQPPPKPSQTKSWRRRTSASANDQRPTTIELTTGLRRLRWIRRIERWPTGVKIWGRSRQLRITPRLTSRPRRLPSINHHLLAWDMWYWPQIRVRICMIDCSSKVRISRRRGSRSMIRTGASEKKKASAPSFPRSTSQRRDKCHHRVRKSLIEALIPLVAEVSSNLIWTWLNSRIRSKANARKNLPNERSRRQTTDLCVTTDDSPFRPIQDSRVESAARRMRVFCLRKVHL